MLEVTCSCCTATHVFILVVKLDSHAFAAARWHTAAATPAKRDGHHAVDVRQHDGHADACKYISEIREGLTQSTDFVCVGFFLMGMSGERSWPLRWSEKKH